MSRVEYTPLPEISPDLTVALPRYVPTEHIGIHQSRLQAYATRLGYGAVTLGAFEGHVTEHYYTAFNAVYSPRFDGGIQMGKAMTDTEDSDTFRLELNAPQVEAWAQKSRMLREPATWANAINLSLKAALVDYSRDMYPEQMSAGSVTYIQFSTMPIRLARSI